MTSSDTTPPTTEIFKNYLDPTRPVLTDDEKSIISHLSGHIVFDSRIQDAIAMIRQIVDENASLSEPRHGLLIGEAGCGKTTLLDILKSEMPEQEETFRLGIRTNIPAVMMSLPTNITPRSMAQQALRAMGVQTGLNGTCFELTEQLCRHIRECNVQLFLLDEFQDLLALGRGTKQGQSGRLRGARAWVKSVINQTQVSFVIMGMHESLALVEGEDQLERRFTHVHVLDPFDIPGSKDTGLVDFVDALLLEAATALPYFNDAEFLGTSGLQPADPMIEMRKLDATRMFAATLGVPSRLKDLVIRAALLAHRRQSRCITMADFTEAFEQRHVPRLKYAAGAERRAARQSLLKALDSKVINPFKTGKVEIDQLVMKMAA